MDKTDSGRHRLPGNYQRGDIVAVPVSGDQVAVAQIVESLSGNVLLAVSPGLWLENEATRPETWTLDEPVLLAETMDLRIKEGVWRRLGTRPVPASVPVPVYKVWVEPPGEYRRMDIRGTVGEPLSPQDAELLPNSVSFSPAAVEAALRGLHGLGPWLPEFDRLVVKGR